MRTNKTKLGTRAALIVAIAWAVATPRLASAAREWRFPVEVTIHAAGERGAPARALGRIDTIRPRDDDAFDLNFEPPISFGTSEISTVRATISAANRRQLERVIQYFPVGGYIDARAHERAVEMARVFATEPPVSLTRYPGCDLVGRMEVRMRRELAPHLDQYAVALPELKFPTALPLKVVYDRDLDRVVSAEMTGSFIFSKILAITPACVGLNGRSVFGGPDGMAALNDYKAVYVHDRWVRDLVEANAEVRRVRRQILAEFKRINGVPDIVVERGRILTVVGGRGDDANYTSSADVETCVSLLTGLPLDDGGGA